VSPVAEIGKFIRSREKRPQSQDWTLNTFIYGCQNLETQITIPVIILHDGMPLKQDNSSELSRCHSISS
jgi:hypothetical protein